MKKYLKKLSNIFKSKKKKKRECWREKNSHNFTKQANTFPIDIVKVGKYTYGSLFVKHFGTSEEKLEIGNFVSIADGVKFILGGNHHLDTITTYPFKEMLFNEHGEALTKGKIIIEDDVWIGTDALILSGVKIGQG